MNLLLILTSAESLSEEGKSLTKIVTVSKKAKIRYFCERWIKSGGDARIDLQNDPPYLRAMWKKTWDLPSVPLPVTIDCVVQGISD